MRHLGGILLLLGISVGLFLYWPATIPRSAQTVATKTQQVQPTVSNLPGAASTDFLRFSPDAALNWPVSFERVNANPPTADNRLETLNSASTSVDVPTARDWQSSMTAVSGSIESRSGVAESKAMDPSTRYELISAIQRHLKLRGCYWGRIDGAWGAGSRYAMQTYLDRINAELPLKEPDPVLLTMLQASDSQRCAACPAGQASTIGGRCMPEAALASEQRRSIGRQLGGAEFQERMAIGGPTEMPPPAYEEGPWSSDNSDTANNTFVDGDYSEAGPTNPASQKYVRSKRQNRSVQAARERNLMLSLGGGY